MRTKTLLITAALSAVGVASSMAQVFSQNAVGYYTLNLVEGFNLVANQLNNGDNSIGTVFPVVPDGTSLLKWDADAQMYTEGDVYFDPDGWFDNASGEPSVTTLGPGEGAFLNTPVAGSITIVGEVPQGDPLPSVGISALFSIGSQPTPQALGLGGQSLGAPGADDVPANDGDSVLFWDAANQVFTDGFVFFDPDGWFDNATSEPANPTPAVGEAFFYNNAGAAINWTRSFSVN